jgi:hypothetical protein
MLRGGLPGCRQRFLTIFIFLFWIVHREFRSMRTFNLVKLAGQKAMRLEALAHTASGRPTRGSRKCGGPWIFRGKWVSSWLSVACLSQLTLIADPIRICARGNLSGLDSLQIQVSTLRSMVTGTARCRYQIHTVVGFSERRRKLRKILTDRCHGLESSCGS